MEQRKRRSLNKGDQSLTGKKTERPTNVLPDHWKEILPLNWQGDAVDGRKILLRDSSGKLPTSNRHLEGAMAIFWAGGSGHLTDRSSSFFKRKTIGRKPRFKAEHTSRETLNRKKVGGSRMVPGRFSRNDMESVRGSQEKNIGALTGKNRRLSKEEIEKKRPKPKKPGKETSSE